MLGNGVLHLLLFGSLEYMVFYVALMVPICSYTVCLPILCLATRKSRLLTTDITILATKFLSSLPQF